MAEIVAAFGVPHTPLLWRMMRDEVPSDLEAVQAEFVLFRGLLADADPDVIVFVGSDHFHQFNHASMPAFAVGKAEHIPGTYPNEERSFGLPPIEVPGHPGIAEAILGRSELKGGFDFAFSNHLRLDHAYVVPLLYLRPSLDVPVVPIHTNTNAPPLPSASRFADLGRFLRDSVKSHPADLRVVVMATGHLAYELGAPRQFLGRSTDPDFDAQAVDWIRRGAVAEAVAGSSFDRFLEAGNLSFQFLNFITLAAAAGGPASFAEGVPCRFGNEPFFAWGPQ